MSGSIQMPKYKCHKEVWALKIEQVKADNAGRTYLHFADERYAPIEIANGWLMKHMPVPGGYYVQYQDGYTSYSPAEAFESGYALTEKLEVPDPSKNEMSVAFRLAAQIAGIKDEVSDFMAGLDGALMAGKSVEDLCDELQERIALYDTPEAVDLFMQMVKGRSGVELPSEILELLKPLSDDEVRIVFVVNIENHDDSNSITPFVNAAVRESFAEDEWIHSSGYTYNWGSRAHLTPECDRERLAKAEANPFIASNGVKVGWFNCGSLTFTQKVDRYNSAAALAVGNEKELPANKTNQQGQIELLTAALDAARHELDGKYISATATVIDAYQLPLDKDVIANSFVEWARGHSVKWSSGSPDCLQVYQIDGIELMEAYPGEWVTKCNNGAIHVFEPEVFATLYTSAAELLK